MEGLEAALQTGEKRKAGGETPPAFSLAFATWSAGLSGPRSYRSVNVSSIVTRTGTGSPSLRPAMKRHCLTASMAF